jgi:hypothetical protein
LCAGNATARAGAQHVIARFAAFVLQRFACFGHSFTKFALTTVQAHKVNFARHPKTTF